jgi:hypothetical protein
MLSANFDFELELPPRTWLRPFAGKRLVLPRADFSGICGGKDS